MKKTILTIYAISLLLWSCGGGSDNNADTSDSLNKAEKVVEDIPVTLSIIILKPEGSKYLDTTAHAEELGKGFGWAEGPVWVEALNAVLFSDVPGNTIYKWSEKDSLSVYLTPSGNTDSINKITVEGSNGLSLDKEGDLIICQHGDRRIASLTSGVQNPTAQYTTLADNCNGKKFNSPNDLAIKSNGDIYFTDPSYGVVNDSKREIKYHGVYKMATSGEVTLLLDSLSWPNGIAFSPDEKTVYIANSDREKAVWYSYKVDDKGLLKDGKVLYDATDMVKKGEVGLPDGLKVHSSGTLFATGPGGVYLINPKGANIGIIKTSKATANCAFDKGQEYVYLTTTDRFLRVKLK